MSASREPIANLGMYDADPAANDAFWAALRAQLLLRGVSHVPGRLERELPLPCVWAAPELLFGQICGAPYASDYADRLTLLGTPHYGVPGCEGAYHRSFVIVHRASRAQGVADLRGACVAVNDVGSNTGFNLLGDWLSQGSGGEPIGARLVISGAHVESLRLVAARAADVAAIDCVTYAFLARHHPELVAATRVLAHTAPTPAPPWVVSSTLAADLLQVLRDSLSVIFSSAKTRAARSRLFLDGFSELPASSYQGTRASAERARAAMLPHRVQLEERRSLHRSAL